VTLPKDPSAWLEEQIQTALKEALSRAPSCETMLQGLLAEIWALIRQFYFAGGMFCDSSGNLIRAVEDVDLIINMSGHVANISIVRSDRSSEQLHKEWLDQPLVQAYINAEIGKDDP
jgi:hypothetical protein